MSRFITLHDHYHNTPIKLKPDLINAMRISSYNQSISQQPPLLSVPPHQQISPGNIITTTHTYTVANYTEIITDKAHFQVKESPDEIENLIEKYYHEKKFAKKFKEMVKE